MDAILEKGAQVVGRTLYGRGDAHGFRKEKRGNQRASCRSFFSRLGNRPVKASVVSDEYMRRATEERSQICGAKGDRLFDQHRAATVPKRRRQDLRRGFGSCGDHRRIVLLPGASQVVEPFQRTRDRVPACEILEADGSAPRCDGRDIESSFAQRFDVELRDVPAADQECSRRFSGSSHEMGHSVRPSSLSGSIGSWTMRPMRPASSAPMQAPTAWAASAVGKRRSSPDATAS